MKQQARRRSMNLNDLQRESLTLMSEMIEWPKTHL
jgi:hypothetical protein